MSDLKDFLQRKKELAYTIFIHVGLLLASLVLSYNSYKEYVKRDGDIFPLGLKAAIKATFPWSIIIFVVLYLANVIARHKKDGYPSIWQYIIIFALQAIIINLVFASKDTVVLIVQNLAILYFAIFLLIWNGMRRVIVIDTEILSEELLPPIIHKSLQKNMPRIRAYFKEKPSAPFIIGFMALLMLCAFLLIFGAAPAAEELANIAYSFLVIGVGIEVYQLIKHGERD